MGRGSFTGGNVFAQNLQAGSLVKAVSGAGWETTSVVYSKVMQNIPHVVITQVAGNSDTTSTPTVKAVVRNVSKEGFNVDFVSTTTGVVYYDYHAYDDSYY